MCNASPLLLIIFRHDERTAHLAGLGVGRVGLVAVWWVLVVFVLVSGHGVCLPCHSLTPAEGVAQVEVVLAYPSRYRLLCLTPTSESGRSTTHGEWSLNHTPSGAARTRTREKPRKSHCLYLYGGGKRKCLPLGARASGTPPYVCLAHRTDYISEANVLAEVVADCGWPRLDF